MPVGDENRSDVIDCVKVRQLYHLMDQADAVQTDYSRLYLAAIKNRQCIKPIAVGSLLVPEFTICTTA